MQELDGWRVWRPVATPRKQLYGKLIKEYG